jgi:hypothetical protein
LRSPTLSNENQNLSNFYVHLTISPGFSFSAARSTICNASQITIDNNSTQYLQHLHAPPTTPIILSSGSIGLLHNNNTLVDNIQIKSNEAYASSTINIIVRIVPIPLLIGNIFFTCGSIAL